LRLFNPDAHIPSTTAFDAVFPGVGRNLVLQRGANVFMPSNTPAARRKDYLLYPNKPCVDETTEDCSRCVAGRIWALGRLIGEGPGHSLKRRWQARQGEGLRPLDPHQRLGPLEPNKWVPRAPAFGGSRAEPHRH